MSNNSKQDSSKSLHSRYVEHKGLILTSAAIVGSLTLALFEYVGLVSDSMHGLYKVGIGLGTVIICLGYLVASRGTWRALPLCLVFAVYIFAGAFSGRTTVTVEAEKNAQHQIKQGKEKDEARKALLEAAKLANEHKTVKHNQEVYKGLANLSNDDDPPPPITTDERRNSAVMVLAQLGIHTTSEVYETLLSAFFTLCLFIAVGVLGRRGKVSGISRDKQDIEGDQQVTHPENANQDKRTSYTDEELETAIDYDIATNDRKDYTNELAHKAIKSYFKSDISGGKPRVAEIVKRKKKELAAMKREKGSTSRFGWKLLKGGKK
jgi:hypothetical protein